MQMDKLNQGSDSSLYLINLSIIVLRVSVLLGSYFCCCVVTYHHTIGIYLVTPLEDIGYSYDNC